MTRKITPRLNFSLDGVVLFHEGLGLRRVTPQIRCGYVFFKFGEFEFLGRQVKDAPIADASNPERTLIDLPSLAFFLQVITPWVINQLLIQDTFDKGVRVKWDKIFGLFTKPGKQNRQSKLTLNGKCHATSCRRI